MSNIGQFLSPLRFRKECPDGKLTRHHLRALFQKVFPDGNASKITSHVFRIFDSDGNDFLDFKEFLMAIDIANRDTGMVILRILT